MPISGVITHERFVHRASNLRSRSVNKFNTRRLREMKCKRWAEQKKGETVKNGRVFKEHMLALTQEANNPTGPGERDPFKLDF